MRILFLVIIMLAAINASGQWEVDTRISDNSVSSFIQNQGTIASNGNVIHAVWFDFRISPPKIYYIRSTNNGTNWGISTRISNDSSKASDPVVCTSGSFVHVAFVDERHGLSEIYYKQSNNEGTTWGPDIRLTNNGALSYYPSIYATGQTVHITWFDSRTGRYNIFYKRSTDNGITWGNDLQLTNSSGEARDSYITSNGSFVCIVWVDTRDFNKEIYCKKSTDGGQTWSDDIRLTNFNSDSVGPTLSVNGSFIHIAWADRRDNHTEIYYKNSTDSGLSWSIDTRMTNLFSDKQSPNIAVSGNIVHLVWQQCTLGIFNPEIQYTRSTNNGMTWDTGTRLTYDSVESYDPSITVSGQSLHVLWQDKRDGYNAIYYKRNLTGNVGIQNISTEIPSAYSLGQNYPNPFNARTVIRFEVQKLESRSQNSEVTLKIFDITGKEVATLVNERLQAGTYETTFDGSGLNSGVYFYRLTTDGFSETKRMVLIK
ncbi:MAG: T9SS type A sorting domain-containing protein [Candidatus Kapaibacterium sp.]